MPLLFFILFIAYYSQNYARIIAASLIIPVQSIKNNTTNGFHTHTALGYHFVSIRTHNYTTEYKPGQCNANTDGFSRLPFPNHPSDDVPTPVDTIFLLDYFQNMSCSTNRLMDRFSNDDYYKVVKPGVRLVS